MEGTETNQKWSHITIESDLARKIDEVVKVATIHGVRKYISRADFARDAIHMLLEEYLKEQSKVTRKKLGEEIPVVARK